MHTIKIGNRMIGDSNPVFFIADISANHDGELDRAKMLIHMAAESGADAAKFQNFRADKIVSNRGFLSLQGQYSHQAKWKKSVYEVYQDASLPWEWTEELKTECDAVGIEYFSTPYDFEAVDMLDPYVSVFKIGSGDITWPEMLRKVASKDKPVMLATGASDIADVLRAIHEIANINSQLILMQCNTNYEGKFENFNHIHLNVLKIYNFLFPNYILGLSDHTSGNSTVLGAVALGARVIEKHFTDDNSRIGPDHSFSMTPAAWREMVERTRELELALGDIEKRVADNERDTIILQRRCLRASRDIPGGSIVTRDMIDVLRPAPDDAIFPYEIDRVLGLRLRAALSAGEYLQWKNLE